MKALRTTIFWIHLVLGCVAGLVILTMSVTGVLLAFERQINALADAPAVLQGQRDSSTQEPLDLLLATLLSNGQGTPSQLVLHNAANAPVEARFGRERTLYLNPWTGEIIGQPSERTRAFFATVERFHRSLGLGMQSAFGRGITGAANLAFLFMLVSGIYLWFPKIFSIASLKTRLLFRRGLQARTREWNWHHVVGFWTAIPLLFIVVTGVIISYPWASNLLYTATGTQPPANGFRGDRGPSAADPGHAAVRAARQADGARNRVLNGLAQIAKLQMPSWKSITNTSNRPPAAGLRGNRRPSAAGGGNHDTASETDHASYRALNDLAQIAKLQIPAWKSITIAVPQPQAPTVDVSVDTSIGGQPEKASQLVINRQSGHIDAVRSFSDNNTGRKLRAWARFLHTGEEFGLFGQFIAAIACLAAILLVYTGLSMTVRRVLARIKRVPVEEAVRSRATEVTVAG